ncbi:MAG TPA: two-component regulator propeller domain-containing protein [Chitinophagaceae bacterium]
MKALSFKKRYSSALWLKTWVCIVIFILQSFICVAQPALDKIQFNHFSTDHDLTQTGFTSILQDRKGYMWFGSYSGLIKFDGYRFTHYNYDPSDKRSLPANDIVKLCEDRNGGIWMAAASNVILSRFDPPTESFTVYQKNENSRSEGLPGYVQSMIADKQGKVWIGTDAGLCFYDPVSGKIIRVNKKINADTLSSQNIYCLMIDHRDMLWIGTANGVNTYDPSRQSLKLFNPPDKNYSGLSKEVHSLLEDHAGNIWIGVWSLAKDVNKRGIYRYTPSTGSSTFYTHDSGDPRSLNPGFVNTLIEDRFHNIWAGMYEGGISIYQPARNDFVNYKADASGQHALSSNHVMSIVQDRSDVVWIGTDGGGLNNCYLTSKQFNVFRNYDKEYTSHYPLGLYKSQKGNIYLATFGAGLSKFNPETGVFISYKADPNNDFNYCYGALEDREGNLWAIGFNEGLYKFDRKAGRFITVHSTSKNKDTSFHNISNAIVEDRSKRLWIGTNKGLKCYDLLKKMYSPAEELYPKTAQLSNTVIVSLYCDPDEILWIATTDGFYLFDTKKGILKIFRHDDNNAHSISNNQVTSFLDDGTGIVWIGTEGGGLNRFDKATERFARFTTKEGLPDNSIFGILKDAKGDLWLSSNKGICRFTPPSAQNKKAVCRNYNSSDGLPGSEFYYNTCVKTDNGLFYYAGKQGLVAFDPGGLKDNQYIPAVVITGFSVFNKTVSPNDSTAILKYPADVTKEIRLNYHQNHFSFSFAALNYMHPEKNEYAYKLEGYDKDWVYTNAGNRIASYTNLDAGKYIFKVKASNNDGVWNEEGVVIKLTITAPWWQTWWFLLLCLLVIVIIVYAIYYNRMQKLRDIRSIRNKIASDLHDDLGATLSSISIMSELVNQQVKDQVPGASSMLEKIGASSRNMIESVNDMVWAIDPVNDSFENIIKRMRGFASEILGAKDIAFHFDYEKDLLPLKLKMDARRNFYLLFKEAVNNVAKYACATNVFMSIRNNENILQLTIRDDGNGFDSSAVSPGNGLINMRQRAALMKARFSIESIPGKGTLIELEFKNE